MYAHRQPITDAHYEAFMAAPVASPKPHVTSAGGRRRIMTFETMGEWMLARPGCTIEHLRTEFTEAELSRFLPAAKDYAIRRSGDAH